MTRQIRLLTKVSFLGLFGWNEFRFTKDRKKKTKYCLMGLLWLLVIVMMVAYVCAASYGLVFMGLGRFVPAVLVMSVSLVVFFFTLFKAGPVLFERRTYEKQISLPITIRAIIISRFFSMYLTNMLLGMLVMLPGMAVYGIMERPGLIFYVYGIVAILFLPLLPLTAASILGALITGISSRWRRKNLVSILLSLILVCGILMGSFRMGGMQEDQLAAMVQELALVLENQIMAAWPPAIWVMEAMAYGRTDMLLLFLGVSAGVFVVFLEVLRHFYSNICSLLSSHETKGNYRMRQLEVKSVRRSMLERELRHYFSSTVYVTNTVMGELLMVILAVAVLVMGSGSVEKMMGIPGIVERALPLLLGFLAVMMPMTSCSISMEGKQWWMMQTLPITKRDLVWGKTGACLLVAFPFYLVSEVLLLAALKPDFINGLCLVAVPAVYIVFGARAGLAINERLPIFDWDNEVRVVKQSASTMVSLLVGAVAALVPLGVLVALPELPAHIVYAVVVCVLGAGIWIMEAGGKKAVSDI